MAYSNLVSVVCISPNKDSPRLNRYTRSTKVDSIAIHCMAGQLTALQCGQLFQKPERQASSNYGVGSDGKIGLYVDEDDRSWCTSSSNVDNRAITIEVASDVTDPCRVSDSVYSAMLELLVDICHRHNITLRWMNDKEYAYSACPPNWTNSTVCGPVDRQNIFLHRWYNTSKSCPGEYLLSKMPDIVKYVNARLAQIASGTSPVPTEYSGEVLYYEDLPISGTGTSASEDSATISTQQVNTIKIHPDFSKIPGYVITLDRNSDLSSLNNLDSGLLASVGYGMIEAGYAYTKNHTVCRYFTNSKLDEEISFCDAHNLSYGLFVVCRAQTVAEAKTEMRRFTNLSYRVSPKLGVWLKLENQTSSEFEKILEYYSEILDNLGFKKKKGLYVDRNTFDRVSDYYLQYNWMIWLIDPVSSESDIKIEPQFFEL